MRTQIDQAIIARDALTTGADAPDEEYNQLRASYAASVPDTIEGAAAKVGHALYLQALEYEPRRPPRPAPYMPDWYDIDARKHHAAVSYVRPLIATAHRALKARSPDAVALLRRACLAWEAGLADDPGECDDVGEHLRTALQGLSRPRLTG